MGHPLLSVFPLLSALLLDIHIPIKNNQAVIFILACGDHHKLNFFTNAIVFTSVIIFTSGHDRVRLLLAGLLTQG